MCLAPYPPIHDGLVTRTLLQLPEGVYIVGSGSTGAAEAMAVMGAAYFAIMSASALAIRRFVSEAPIPVKSHGSSSRRPAKGHLPAGYTPPAASATGVSAAQV